MTTGKMALSSRVLVLCIIILALLSTSVGKISAMGNSIGANGPANALGNYTIVFVSRKIPSNGSVYYSSTGSMPGVQPWSRFQVAAPGKLVIREANGTLRTLIDGSNPTSVSLNLIDVNAPDVSYDATKIIFAGLPAGSYSTGPMAAPGAWRIYMINVDGTGLKQITFSDRNINLSQFGSVASNFAKYDDTDPAWLPDGRIVFSSTRWPSFGQYGAALTSNLYVVNSNGTNPHRITAERNGAERPVVDPLTGKIVYARWWRNFRLGTNNMATMPYSEGGYIMKDGICALKFQGAECQEAGGLTNLERNAWHLATINPDGTGLAQFAGRSNSFFYGEIINHAYGGAFATDGSFYANFFPMQNGTEAAGFGGIRLYKRGANGYTPIIGITNRDESVLQFARTNPPSYGVYVGNYASEPAVLPDGRLVISWARDTKQDYGLYTINSDGSGLTLVYDNPNTTELRTRLVLPRPVPPIIPDKVTQVASALPPTAQGPYDIDGTFTFNDLNVYFNAPVDANIISAPPVGSANTIRFFIDHQRNQQRGSFEYLDWPILLKEVPVNPNGSISTSSPANVPLFEQLRTSQAAGYTIPPTGPGLTPSDTPGAAHVAGMNFGRTGDIATCVGCHAGHTMIPVPSNPADAQWTNLAPGATVSVSSTGSGSRKGINDRRLKMQLPYDNSQKFWTSNSGNPTSQWVKLTFPVPVTVRTIRLYNIPGTDSSIKVLNTNVKLYSDSAGTIQVASKASGALSESGTDVAFNSVRTRVVKIEFTSVNGSTAGLGEVEVIASAGEDASLLVSGNVGLSGVTLNYPDGSVPSDQNGDYSIAVPNNWSGTVTPTHPCYTFSPLNLSYNNVTSNQAGQNYTATFNSASGCADITVTIGTELMGTYDLTSGEGLVQSYSGADGGPVIVKSTTGANIVASYLQLRRPGTTGGWTGITQTMGLTDAQISDKYVFPYYDYTDATRYNSLQLANFDSVATNVIVEIGGVQQGSFPLGAGSSQNVTFSGVKGGPVVVYSDNGADIVASLYELKRAGNSGSWTGQTQMMGLPWAERSDTYVIPRYNYTLQDLLPYVAFANADSIPTSVTVTIGTELMGTYDLTSGEGLVQSYSGANGGPVVVKSNNGAKIVASYLQLRRPGTTGGWTGITQTMGLTDAQIFDKYVFPYYDYTDPTRYNSLQLANFDSVATNVIVEVGGVQQGSFPLDVGSSQNVTFSGVKGGPVVVYSDNGADIVASLYELKRAGSTGSWMGQNQMMGLPWTQLSDTYVIPRYNYTLQDLLPSVMFAVP